MAEGEAMKGVFRRWGSGSCFSKGKERVWGGLRLEGGDRGKSEGGKGQVDGGEGRQLGGDKGNEKGRKGEEGLLEVTVGGLHSQKCVLVHTFY
ncbi:hypothetical protein GOBAR_DD22938 [Gossypium barbadense]|nr:hypothetical protein GOBAR_DD22938 [Gossypium barbadense]